MPREFARKDRIAAEIQRLLNELLLSEVKDPRLSGARVSDVEVTGDLSLATIYFNTLQLDEDPTMIKQGFEQARGFFRTRVAGALQLRRVPELRFRHDTSARRASELQRLIDDTGDRDRTTE
ncbi:MAG TPA: 30S ribosome-binding factor RbfA [Gammaproteobacteria bacterium]|jgi:ribosome-binding factor A|nr:30S ribosome-binding factor RbfA [Gammaproteobacteria bacterium]